MLTVYGLKTCDTTRKALKWLEKRQAAHRFLDVRADGVDIDKLSEWAMEVGWEALLNRRGTTFRKLPEGDKTDLDAAKAIALMEAHPSAIKRPVVEYPGGLLVGFDPEEWDAALG